MKLYHAELTGSRQKTCPERGFALIATISVMVLLVMIALAMLSLSTITMRSSSNEAAQSEARSNARMALMMAIGQLQQLSGADTRVTASSTMIDENNVPLTGVWRSWEGSDRQNDGHPIAPAYDQKMEQGDSTVDVAGDPGDGRFLGWLTSAELPVEPDAAIPENLVSSTQQTGMVAMIGEQSVDVDNKPQEQVYVKPTQLQEGGKVKGSMAWWTSGDNQKATINTEIGDHPDTIVAWQQRIRSGSRPDPTVFNLEVDAQSNLNTNKVLLSNASLDLVPSSGDLRRFHDMTTFGRGLLTNTANGGWRRDLSLMTESYDGDATDGDPALASTPNTLPDSDLPFHTLKPGEVGMARKAANDVPTAGALIYPWAEYSTKWNNGSMRNQYSPVSSWTSMVDFAMQYKQLGEFSAGRTSYQTLEHTDDLWPSINSSNKLGWFDKIRLTPVLARTHFLFSLASGIDADGKYFPMLKVHPVVTLWNPYNVQLTVNKARLEYRYWSAVGGLRFRFQIDNKPLYPTPPGEDPEFLGNTLPEMLLHKAGVNEDTGREGSWVKRVLTAKTGFGSEVYTLEPGATKIFSMSDPNPQTPSDNAITTLVEGYVPGAGILIELVDLSHVAQTGGKKTLTPGLAKGRTDQFATVPVGNVNRIVLTGTESFTSAGVDATAVDKAEELSYTSEVLKRGISGSRIATDAVRYKIDDMADGGQSGIEVIRSIWPNLESNNLLSGSVSSFTGGRTGNFLAAIKGVRGVTPFADPDPAEQPYHHQLSRGMLQANPLGAHSNMGEIATANAVRQMAGMGVYHPINNNIDYSFRPVSESSFATDFGWIPASNGSETYIMTGLEASSGLNRCVMAEVLTRPMQSLGDLQHWDARGNNPFPPFQLNLIGNSSATPIIPPQEVYVKGASGIGPEHMCNDDSYLLNTMLFDDWFVSSLAPDYGSAGISESRSILQVYQDHLDGTESLPNRFYLPANTAQSDDPADIVSGSIIPDPTNPANPGKYAFETLASKLSVDGMFNINSTSVDAWRALLRQAGSLEVPVIDGSASTSMDSSTSYAFPRTSIAGDRASDSGSTASGTPFFDAAELAGYRVFTEAQIDELANQIVEQIRKRGPFLSLSEFVNRRLDATDTDLALAGTIQKALDNLADLGAANPLNPFSELQASSVEITGPPPGNADYGFPEAALGHSAFGLPGWTRQADILRPLAPRLSARDDTFTIRAYGDARDPADSTKILAQAWCEAVVVRAADFVDPTDDATVLPYSAAMRSNVNPRFGRKYRMVSFRWLNAKEI